MLTTAACDIRRELLGKPCDRPREGWLLPAGRALARRPLATTKRVTRLLSVVTFLLLSPTACGQRATVWAAIAKRAPKRNVVKPEKGAQSNTG